MSIFNEQHQFWKDGVDLFNDAVQNKHFISTGLEGIDILLEGGLRKGQVTELVGPPSSGKTQICLCAASNVVYKHIGAVMFLDTGNSFSPKRIESIISSLSMEEAPKIALESMMNQLFYHPVFDIFALLENLKELNVNLKQPVNKGCQKLCLLIVDSVSSLLSPIIGGKSPNGRSLMVKAGFILKSLANEHNISVLVTNHTVRGKEGSSKPALGESWKTVPHVRLFLSYDRDIDTRNASILKHSSVAVGRLSKFSIPGGGGSISD